MIDKNLKISRHKLNKLISIILKMNHDYNNNGLQ